MPPSPELPGVHLDDPDGGDDLVGEPHAGVGAGGRLLAEAGADPTHQDCHGGAGGVELILHKLTKAHPTTDGGMQKRNLGWNPDGFFGPPPLIPRVISLCILKNDPTPKSVTI